VPADQRRVWDFSPAGIRASLAGSRQRLGLDRIDVAMLHDPDEQEPSAVGPAITSGLAALATLRAEGAVDMIGIGSKSTDALLTAVRTGLVDVVMVAGRYTLLEQPAAEQLLPECAERGITVLAAAVFNSGLLATPDPGPDARYEYGTVPPAVLARARTLAARCAEHGVELPTAALQFPLRHPAVGRVVLAGADAAQVRQNVARVAAPVPEQLWAELEAVPA
jgi:D-threo-aldose 1-dehydrogenase